MAKSPRLRKAELDEIATEHRALKERTDALRKEHNQLHSEGGSKAAHEEHIRHLRQAIRDLEHHVEHLKRAHSPGGGVRKRKAEV